MKLRKLNNYDGGSWVPPCRSSLSDRLHCCSYIDFHCSYLYSYYNSSRTLCIKIAEIQHFILRFNKISLSLRILPLKEGSGGERRSKDRVKTGWVCGYIYYYLILISNYWKATIFFFKTYLFLKEIYKHPYFKKRHDDTV